MKNQLQNDVWLCSLTVALSKQSTPEVFVALSSVVIGGPTGLLAPFPLNR